jgi:hypothetical protein
MRPTESTTARYLPRTTQKTGVRKFHEYFLSAERPLSTCAYRTHVGLVGLATTAAILPAVVATSSGPYRGISTVDCRCLLNYLHHCSTAIVDTQALLHTASIRRRIPTCWQPSVSKNFTSEHAHLPWTHVECDTPYFLDCHKSLRRTVAVKFVMALQSVSLKTQPNKN